MFNILPFQSTMSHVKPYWLLLPRPVTLYVYSKAEQGGHFLAFKNPFRFAIDLQTFLDALTGKA